MHDNEIFHAEVFGWFIAHHEAPGLPSDTLANSLSYKFHLPGVHFIHSETFALKHSTELQTVDWERFGFKLHIPPGTFSEHYLNITIGVSLSGNFKFPTDTTLVSAVYYIEMTSKLLQPVTMEIEHCVIAKEEEHLQALSFATAAIHPGYPLHNFDAISGGIFSTSNSWGSIQVSSFSEYSIISNRTDLLGYSAQVVYQQKASNVYSYRFQVRLVVTRHLSVCKEVSDLV